MGDGGDTMKKAADRLGISRSTLKIYLQDQRLTEPRWVLHGMTQDVRVFDEDWYAINEPRIAKAKEARKKPPTLAEEPIEQVGSGSPGQEPQAASEPDKGKPREEGS